jgi:hypothetical protein
MIENVFVDVYLNKDYSLIIEYFTENHNRLINFQQV